MTGIPDNFD
jgi:aubergine